MEHGVVTSVNYKDGVVYCDVRAIRVNTEYPSVPVMTPHSGFVTVPEEEDLVAMDRLEDGKEFISQVISRAEDGPESLSEGDLTLQLDGGTRIEFSKNGNGDYDLHLDASGDLYIDGIDFDEHTHDYTWEDTAGSDTTDPPE